MFCSKDVIGSGEAISQLVLIDKKTKKVIDYGVDQYYVYIKGKTKNKRLKELLKIFRECDYSNEKLFPSLSSAKHKANNLEKGDFMMLYGSDLEMYVKGEKKGREDGIKVGEARGEKRGEARGEKNILKSVVKMIKNGLLTIDVAIKDYGIDKNKLTKMMATIN